MTDKTLRALESTIRAAKIGFDPSRMTSTQIIACDGLVDDWTPGNYAVDDVRNHGARAALGAADRRARSV